MGADIHIKIDGGSEVKPAPEKDAQSSSSQKPTKQKGPDDGKGGGLSSFAPEEPPPDWAQKAISNHQAGKSMVPVFVDAQLAKDLEAYYGPDELVAAHNMDEHGPMGHMLPEEQKEPQNG